MIQLIGKFQLVAKAQVKSTVKPFATARVEDEVDEKFTVDLKSFHGFCVYEAKSKHGAEVVSIDEIRIVPGSTAYRIVLQWTAVSGKANHFQFDLDSEAIQRFGLFNLVVHMAQKAKHQEGQNYQQIISVKVIPLMKDDFTQAHF